MVGEPILIPSASDTDEANQGSVLNIPTADAINPAGTVENPETISTRALKYSFAVNDPERDTAYMASLMEIPGAIEREREHLAFRKDIEDDKFRLQLVQDLAEQAGKEGRKFTSDENKVIQDLTSEEIKNIRTNPETFFEKEYAQRVVTQAASTNETSKINQFPQLGDILEESFAKKEGYQKIYEDAVKDFDSQSTVSTIVNFGATVVPFYQWLRMRNVVEKAEGSSILPGNNLLENIDFLNRLPAEEAITQARQAYNDLASKNPVLARDFAGALMSYSQSDAWWDNLLIAGADLATFVPLGALSKGVRGAARGASTVVARTPEAIVKAAKGVSEATYTYRDLSKVISKIKSRPSEIADAMGDTALASGLEVLEKVKNRSAGTRALTSWDELVNEIPSIFNPTRITEGTYNLSREAIHRVTTRMALDNGRAIQELLLDPLASTVASPASVKVAMDNTLEAFKRQSSSFEKAVLDVSHTPVEESIGGVLNARIAIGGPNGLPFESKDMAEFFKLYSYGLKDAEVVQRGSSFILEVQRPLDMTLPSVRDQLTIDIQSKARPLGNVLARWLTPLRSGDDILPEQVSDELRKNVFAGSKTAKLLGDIAEPLTSLKKKNDLMSFLKFEATAPNPLKPDELNGSFSRTVGDLETKWMSQFNRLPTEEEIGAYYSYVRLNDLHYLTRNIDLYLEKSFRGHMLFSKKFSVPVRQDPVPGPGGAQPSRGGRPARTDVTGFNTIDLNDVEGRVVNTLPTSRESPANVLILDDNPKVYNTNASATAGDAKRAERLVKEEGYSVIQVSPIGSEKLLDDTDFSNTFNNRNINYIVVKEPQSRNLDFKQIPYVEGGRRIMPDGHYVSIPSIARTPDNKSTIFFGDRNLFFVPGGLEQAKALSKNFEKARQMLIKVTGTKGRSFTREELDAAGDITELRQFVNKNLPVTWSEFRRMYQGPKAKYDIRSPILFRPSNASTTSTHKLENFTGTLTTERFSDSVHNSYRGHVNLDFAQERGDLIRSAVQRGDPQLPEFGIIPTQVLDPITSLNQALNDTARGRNFNMMKLQAADAFVAQYDEIIDMPLDLMRADPITTMMNAPFKTAPEFADQVRQAKAYRGRMKQFLGIKSEEASYFDAMAERLLKGVSPAMPEAWRKPWHEAIESGDAVNMARNIAFHSKIGLWNVKQLLLQGQTWAHVISLAGPTTGMRAGASAMLQNIIMNRPDKLMELGSKWFELGGWGSRANFIEATDALRRSGFDNVGREVATREQHMSADVIQKGLNTVLDHGMVFFNRSEAFIRRTAWNAAYMQWRTANPKARLDDLAITGILRRADLMNVNMSQASNASWQQGFASIPTQFWTYQVRLTEQLLGKRLTSTEKLRMLATYSTLYGIPVTASGAVAIWPVHETIRSYLLEQGVETDTNIIANVLNQGVLGTAMQGILGEDTDFESVYGPSGLPFLADVLNGDKDVISALGGASGSVFTEVLLDVAPIVPWLMASFSPGMEANPPTVKDLTDIFTNVSSLGAVEKMWLAMSTGEYLTKRGDTIDTGNTGARAIFNSAFGLKPQRIQDMYLILNNTKKREQLQRDQIAKARKDMDRMLQENVSPEDIEMYSRRIQIRLNTPLFTPREQVDVMSDLFRARRPLIEDAIMRMKRNPRAEEILRRKWILKDK